MKPLKLFSSQESNLFFQGDEESRGQSSISGLFSAPHNNLVTNYRAKFLELAADSIAAASLYLVPEEEGGARLETGQYKARQSHLSLLGKMWFMSDKVKEFQASSP